MYTNILDKSIETYKKLENFYVVLLFDTLGWSTVSDLKAGRQLIVN